MWQIQEQQHLRVVPSFLLRTAWLDLGRSGVGSQGKCGLWKGQFPSALFSEPAAQAGCQGTCLDSLPLLEVLQSFPNRVSFLSGMITLPCLSHPSPTCPQTSLFSNFFTLPWIYLLWKLPTSGRRFPPFIPREDCTDPCLASTTPLPKPRPHCLFHSRKCCCAVFSTCWSSLQKQLHFLHDTKNPSTPSYSLCFCVCWMGSFGIKAAPITVSSLMTWLLWFRSTEGIFFGSMS